MQAEEVVALIALVALQVAHVPQEFHKPTLVSSVFLVVSFGGKFFKNQSINYEEIIFFNINGI